MKDNDVIIKLYLDAKSDYRNAQNLEQTILNFGVAILAVFASVGFSQLGKMVSWCVFDLLIPFFISLVSILYMHQKYRSKVYKVYISSLEEKYCKELGDVQTFEKWRNRSEPVFIRKRTGFKYCFSFILLLSPIIFQIIGDILCGQENNKIRWVGWIIKAIVVGSYYIDYKYINGINNLVSYMGR